MNSTKIEDRTSIKFLMMNSEVTDALGGVYGDNDPKKLLISPKMSSIDERNEQAHCRGVTGVSDGAFPATFFC